MLKKYYGATNNVSVTLGDTTTNTGAHTMPVLVYNGPAIQPVTKGIPMSGSLTTQSPMVLSVIQNDFVTKMTNAFSTIGGYATEIFYIIAAIELVLFGIAFAMRGEEGLSTLAIKIFKLAVIFTIITSYPRLLSGLIDGFTHAAFGVAGGKASTALFDPASIWQYGFDAGIKMTKMSIEYGTLNVGMSNLYMIIGFGLLVLFALIGTQIILMVSGFYIVSLLALLVLPLGAFFGMKNFFERAIEAVFRMGARVFALIMVLGVATTVWAQFDLSTISETTTLTKPLGLFFATLVFWILCLKLPGLVVEAIGSIGGKFFGETSKGGGSVDVPAPVTNVAAAPGQVAAGSSMSGAAVSTSGTGVASGATGVTAAANIQTSSAGGAAGGGAQVSVVGGAAGGASPSSSGKSSAKKGADVGISRQTLGKLKSTFKQAMRETKSN